MRKKLMRSLVLLSLLLITTVSQAQDSAAKTRVAQMAFLAQLAPKVCTDYTTNLQAVAAYMAGAGINERELLRDYGSATSEAAQAFTDSATRDADSACDQIWQQLGDDGLGLLSAEN